MKKKFARHIRQHKRLTLLYNSVYFAPLIIFTAIMLITYGAWRASRVTLNNDFQTALNAETTRTEETIKQKLGYYEQILTGGAGLIRASDVVTKSEWHDYVNTYQLKQDFSSALGIGYIKIFGSQELPSVLAFMHEQGVEDFRLIPDTPRAHYSAVLFSEPDSAPQLIGRDFYTDPERLSAMMRASDTGNTTITKPVRTISGSVEQAVVFMFVPQYASGALPKTPQERRQSLRGFTFVALRANDFLAEIAKSLSQNESTVLRVTSEQPGGESETVYEPQAFGQLQNQKNTIKSDRSVDLFGQTWRINYVFKPNGLIRSDRQNIPTWTLLAGFTFSLLLAEIIFLLLKARANDLAAQKDKAVDLAKDELLSLASHQLRTPATTVKQYLGMVLQGFAGDLSKTQTSLLAKAYAGNERQLYIINEMLHIARIDAGRIVLAKKNTDIVKLVSDIVNDAKSEIDEAKHKLTIKLPKQPVMLRLDEHLLRMAIENILSNAIKYTPPGGKIYVNATREKSVVRIIIKDTGVGIEQKDFHKLYKLFTRLDNKKMQNVSGTGVGLYLAKHLIMLHKGRLSLTSTPGKGSSFMITLPLTTNKHKLL